MGEHKEPVWVGIDFGTTYSSVAYLRRKVVNGDMRSELFPATVANNSEGLEHFIPSSVCVYRDGDALKFEIGSDVTLFSETLGRYAHLYQFYKLRIGHNFQLKDAHYQLLSKKDVCSVLSSNDLN